MLADALAQYLVWKRWNAWFLIEGSHPEDQALAEAYRRAATKFGAEIVEERVFEDTGGARRTDTGHVQVQAQMPAFTQRAEAHDVVVAADHAGVFAAHLPYQHLGPAAGGGLGRAGPESWHPAHEAWGATQWQTRFEEAARRTAWDEDYQVWMAVRVLGEAVTRTGRRRLRGDPRRSSARGVRPRRLQGREAELPRLGRPAAPADPAARQPSSLGVAAGRVPAPGQPARHARDRPPESTCSR